MSYPNLLDAWRVLLCDNVPAQVRPTAEASWPQALQQLTDGPVAISLADLDLAEQAIGMLRQPGDLEDLESPLWQVCSGDPSDCEARLEALAGGNLFAPTHAVLEELFEATGPAADAEYARWSAAK